MSSDCSKRAYAFFGENNVALAMQETSVECGSLLTFAISYCGPHDRFDKSKARNILDGRLNARLNPENERDVKHTYQVLYTGQHPRRDVMAPIMDALRTLPKNRPGREGYLEVSEVFEDLEFSLHSGRPVAEGEKLSVLPEFRFPSSELLRERVSIPPDSPDSLLDGGLFFG